MIDYILNCRTSNLIIIYCCVYSELLGTAEDVVQNSIKLIRSTGSGSQIDE